MIVFIIGTTAEAIKVAPVVKILSSYGVNVEIWVTLQQADSVLKQFEVLGLGEPDEIIANGFKGKPISNRRETLAWILTCISWTLKNKKRVKTKLRRMHRNSIIVVHGDTLTSVVGSMIAKSLYVKLAHLEAGLRSGSWRHPFPEELNRRIVGKLADIHFAPDENAARALEGNKLVVVTNGNTSLDQLRTIELNGDRKYEFEYAVVLLHRFELLSNQPFLLSTISVILDAVSLPIFWVVDDHASAQVSPILRESGVSENHILGKLPHPDFIELISNAAFVVTDSGGVQEEISFLGTPTIVHRVATERADGLGRNVVLSGWDLELLRYFLSHHEDYRFGPATFLDSPSELVAQVLMDQNNE